MEKKNVSTKTILPVFLLCFFLGTLGIHRFYAGRIASGVLQLLFGHFTLYIWNLVDFIVIIAGRFRDAEGRLICKWVH